MKQKKYSQFNLFIRSLIFVIFSTLAICVYSIFVIASGLLPLRYRYMVIRSFLRTDLRALKYICHIDYEIQGLENIPKDRNGVIMSKHQSTWETFLIPIYFKDPAVLGKRELLWIPFFGWAFAASQPITINRSNKTSAMQQIIRQGTKRLHEGRWIMTFPEGTRVAPGHVGNYRLGGARLATATGYPVIPIAHNAGRYWPRRKFIKQPGTVKVVIGPMIESKGRTPEEVLADVKNWIEDTMVKIDKV